MPEKPEGSEQSDNTVETPDESGKETTEGEQDEVESKDESEEIDIMLPDEETQPVVTEDIDSSVLIDDFEMKLTDEVNHLQRMDIYGSLRNQQLVMSLCMK